MPTFYRRRIKNWHEACNWQWHHNNKHFQNSSLIFSFICYVFKLFYSFTIFISIVWCFVCGPVFQLGCSLSCWKRNNQKRQEQKKEKQHVKDVQIGQQATELTTSFSLMKRTQTEKGGKENHKQNQNQSISKLLQKFFQHLLST